MLILLINCKCRSNHLHLVFHYREKAENLKRPVSLIKSCPVPTYGRHFMEISRTQAPI